MRKILALLFILLLPRLLWGQTTATLPSPPVVLTHVTVIDIPRGRAKSEMTVMLAGEHIIALGRSRNIKVPQSAQVIDATGKYLIPACGTCMFTSGTKRLSFRSSSLTA